MAGRAACRAAPRLELIDPEDGLLRRIDIRNAGVARVGGAIGLDLRALKSDEFFCVAHDRAAKASVVVNRRARDRGQT